VGTALFVAPEVMHNFNNSAYDGTAVDVWSCGIILFIMVYGRHPYLRKEDMTLPPQQQVGQGRGHSCSGAPQHLMPACTRRLGHTTHSGVGPDLCALCTATSATQRRTRVMVTAP
jgi:serine/threonine protein kinase